VRLRGYAQKDPVTEFKNEAFTLFEGLLDRIDQEMSRRVFRIGVARPQQEIPIEQARTNVDTRDKMGLAGGADIAAAAGEPAFAKATQGNKPTQKEKIGRNDPCWCGSGKKWKKCHYPQAG
jgi:preprotein translocase subunit SecA